LTYFKYNFFQILFIYCYHLKLGPRASPRLSCRTGPFSSAVVDHVAVHLLLRVLLVAAELVVTVVHLVVEVGLLSVVETSLPVVVFIVAALHVVAEVVHHAALHRVVPVLLPVDKLVLHVPVIEPLLLLVHESHIVHVVHTVLVRPLHIVHVVEVLSVVAKGLVVLLAHVSHGLVLVVVISGRLVRDVLEPNLQVALGLGHHLALPLVDQLDALLGVFAVHEAVQLLLKVVDLVDFHAAQELVAELLLGHALGKAVDPQHRAHGRQHVDQLAIHPLVPDLQRLGALARGRHGLLVPLLDQGVASFGVVAVDEAVELVFEVVGLLVAGFDAGEELFFEGVLFHVFGEAVDIQDRLLRPQASSITVGLIVPTPARLIVLVTAVIVHKPAVVLVHVGVEAAALVLVVEVVVPVHVGSSVVVEAVVLVVALVAAAVLVVLVAAVVVLVVAVVVVAAGSAELLVALELVALVAALVVVLVPLVAALVAPVLVVALVVALVVVASGGAVALEPDLQLVLARLLHGLVVPPVDQLLGLLLGVGVDEGVDLLGLEVDLGHVGGLVDALEELGAELVQLHFGREAVDEDDRRHGWF